MLPRRPAGRGLEGRLKRAVLKLIGRARLFWPERRCPGLNANECDPYPKV